jgi:hypothetical protein
MAKSYSKKILGRLVYIFYVFELLSVAPKLSCATLLLSGFRLFLVICAIKKLVFASPSYKSSGLLDSIWDL